jgi:tRNA threonylcarbamoyladenosine biosynthesis protein TsaE
MNRAVDELLTVSPEETEELGFRLAQQLPVPSVVLLLGALGTGKTTLTRGIARGLGLEDASLVNSPSFTLINIYQGRCPIYHVDLYRLEGARDHHSTGLEEFLGRDGVTIVEWGERLLVPSDAALVVELKDAGEHSRHIRISRTARPGASACGAQLGKRFRRRAARKPAARERRNRG